MKCHIKTLYIMRTAYTTFTLAASLLIGSGAFAQTGFTLVTGPTSFTGASNLEDGIQVGSSGMYATQFAVITDVLPFLSADAQMNWGALGLTSSKRQNEISQWYGVGAGLRLHQPYTEDRILQPWIGLGLSFMQQNNFSDLANAEGTSYFHWEDGQVYDMPENAENAEVLASSLAPDHNFETKTASEQSLAIPIQLGLNLNLSPRIYASASFAVLAGKEASLDPRPGYNDMITTAQAGLGIRIGKAYGEPEVEYPEEWLLIGDDADLDGIMDKRDRCPGTPENAPIDKRGCPTDSDKDGIADYLDIEPFSAHRRVNAQGVALTEEQWAVAMAPQKQTQDAFQKNFLRVDSEGATNVVTPVDANGRTPAELRLLKAFGSEKSTTTVKAKRSTAIRAAKPASKDLSDDFGKQTGLSNYTAVMPALRPSFRVQLAKDIRTLDMNEVTPLLVKGDVVQKFDNSSAMCFVSSGTLDLKRAEAMEQELHTSGFEDAHIIGEFNGRLMSLDAAKALQTSWESTAARMN
ncbi:MAG: hypothetical protein CL834_05720 [Crocinitomicaceae bacterium]|nr:hypothetical protein [Crocinitomicaceae bacterium]